MWKIVTVEYFDGWFLGLNVSEQQDVLAAIFVLEQYGPTLGRPHVDSLKGTDKVKNLKELRVQHKGKPCRVFFAFDPLRQAVILCGGDKTGNVTIQHNLFSVL
ncbi:MAG: type II toxin-antitoxin system RelE/ParE family toxin [Deltaproteobacteria bacterium]|nr:type II toxin-antitoxin system RelE/ParE family toxin [Deltaproteobacteria bacterium]